MKLDQYFQYLGNSYFVDEALIVGPYPTKDFFRELRDLRGRKSRTPATKLTVLADDGWDMRQTEAIKNLFGKGEKCTTYRVRAPSGQGLVHAKLYYFKLRNEDRSYTKRILLLGSPNASTQGFGVHAETFVSLDFADLEAEQRKDLQDYVGALEAGKDAEETVLHLGRNSWVVLPEIHRADDAYGSGLYGWLRRGRLCHEYKVDQNFGKLTLKLKNPLPRDQTIGVFNAEAFGEVQDSRAFSRAYLGAAAEGSKHDKTAWRGRYFVETYFGHWVSGECFGEKEHEFVRAAEKARAAAIDRIANASDADYGQWLSEFESALTSVVTRLDGRRNEGGSISLETLFNVKNGAVDVEGYVNAAREKLLFDSRRARDSGFRDRFVSGYTFPRVPQLGSDFDDFATDFCESLLLKGNGRSPKNRLARTLHAVLKDHGYEVPDAAEKLRDMLVEHWPRICTQISDYYCE